MIEASLATPQLHAQINDVYRAFRYRDFFVIPTTMGSSSLTIIVSFLRLKPDQPR